MSAATRTIRVAMLAGRRRSAASLLMLDALARLRPQGVEIAAVLCVSELQWSRLRDWYLRFGLGAVAKGLREIGARRGQRADEEEAVLRDRLRSANIAARSLPEICRSLGVPFQLVPDINGRKSLEFLQAAKCKYGVYSGAGILRQPLLDRFESGVLNLHCGSLPKIRGMNGVEWNLYHGLAPEVTLHFIDAGIDTGRILAARTISAEPADRVSSLRGKAIVAGIDLIAELLPRIRELPIRENQPGAGRQFFAMAEPLKLLLADRLAQLPAAESTLRKVA